MSNNTELDQNEILEDANIVILTDENGEDIEFEFLDLIHYGNDDYVVLLPSDPEDVEEGVVILQVKQEGNEETYIDIEDDDTLDKVFEIFKERFEAAEGEEE